MYLIPLLGVYDSVDDIDLNALPEEFVLKPNHSSGKVIICRDKSRINWSKAADTMKNWLRENYYDLTGEWGYKDIVPKIVCEKLLHGDIVDYKFLCFDGQPVLANVIANRAGHHYDLYNVDMNFCCVQAEKQKGFQQAFQRPRHWEGMIEMAKVLSKEFPFVRVDLYDLEGQIYFGELTFSPANGMADYFSKEWDIKLGKQYDLPKRGSIYVY